MNVFSWWERALTYGLIFSGSFVIFFFGRWWFSVRHIPSNFSGLFHGVDLVLFALLSYVVWYQVVNELLSWDSALAMKRTVFIPPRPGWKVALLTAFVPAKEPIDILEKTLRAMVAVEYPHDTWVLDEGDDPAVKKLCTRLKVKHYTRKGKPQYNTDSGAFKAKTKGGNYNSWFDEHGHEYDIIAQHDVDFAPRVEYLNKTLGYFNDPEVAFVGTPQIYGNTHESWITLGAAQQGYGFYGSMQQGLCGNGMHLFIGANHVMRVQAHDDIEGYAGHIVEDHLTGMKLYSKKWKSVYVPEPLLIGEGPTTWDAYFGQQMRWAFGLIDILFRHSPKIFPRMKIRHAIRYFLLQQYYFYGLVQVLGISLIMLYFCFGIQATHMSLQPLAFYYASFLLFQIVIFLWLQRFYIHPREESGFHIAAKILNVAAWPIYFLAFLGVLRNKPMSYQVTPKGSAQYTSDIFPQLKNFFIHFLFGTITAIGIFVAYLTNRAIPQLILWAALNTAVMYGLIIVVILEDLLYFYSVKDFWKDRKNILNIGSISLRMLTINCLALWCLVVVFLSLNAQTRERLIPAQQIFVTTPEFTPSVSLARQ